MSLTKETMSFEELIDKVIPYSGFTIEQIETMAREDLRDEKAFMLIYRGREISCPLDSLKKYFDEKAKTDKFVEETPAVAEPQKPKTKTAKI